MNSKKIEISHIIENIYLGSLNGANSSELIDKYNIKAIVRILEPSIIYDLKSKTDTNYHFIPIYDHPSEEIKPYIQDFFNFMEDNKDKNILIHCMMGISRSATFTLLYLIKKYKMTLNEALDFVKIKRNIVNPNKGFIQQLGLFEYLL